MPDNATHQRVPLSVIIAAGNEERHIAECIASARFADDVMVILDTASTDRTREIAEPLADRLLVHTYEGAAAQRNWAIPQAKHRWIFVLDSDERITPKLREEIVRVLENDGPHDGYRMFRRNYFIGKEVTGCGWQRDDVLRLFRAEKGRYPERRVHPDIYFPDHPDATVGLLKGKLLHYTFDSFDQYIYKFIRYTEWSSHDREKRTPRVGWRHLAGRPLWRFFRQFVMYRGYRDGKTGFVICMMAAFSVFLKYARVWERREQERNARSGAGTESRP